MSNVVKLIAWYPTDDKPLPDSGMIQFAAASASAADLFSVSLNKMLH